MTLDQAYPGQHLLLLAIGDEFARLQAIRFGLMEGAQVLCQSILPGGPVVICKGKQELALGRRLAGQIQVQVMGG